MILNVTKAFQPVNNESKMPNIWNKSLLVPIYKNKGDLQKCEHYKGIKFISYTMKVWKKIIKKRLREKTIMSKNILELCQEGQ